MDLAKADRRLPSASVQLDVVVISLHHDPPADLRDGRSQRRQIGRRLSHVDGVAEQVVRDELPALHLAFDGLLYLGHGDRRVTFVLSVDV